MDDDYLIVAAVDFGTTYSGFAYSLRDEFLKDPTKVALKKWVAGNCQSEKCATCILFNPEGEFDKFGFEAEDKYMELALEGEHHDWYYFRRFKMQLYEKMTTTHDFHLESANGKFLPAIDVFASVIRYLKNALVEECQKQQAGILETDIKWVITVPAIWTDIAKTFMREAAHKAGIDTSRMVIALEPEAAAILTKHLPLSKEATGERLSSFGEGSRYLVCDAGGGTIDIAVHEIDEDEKIRELYRASGGNWGGTQVDKEFFSFLRRILGNETMDTFLKEQHYDLMDLSRDFEIKKRNIEKNSKKKMTLKFPASLRAIFEEFNPNKSLEGEVSKMKDLAGKVTFISDKIQLHPQLAESFFHRPILNIICHLKKIFEQMNVRQVGVILLVGGFAESPFLLHSIKKSFPAKTVIVPQDAGLAVLKGAVIFGHDPALIRERVAKYTYGILYAVDFMEDKHRQDYKVIKQGRELCNNIFHKYVGVGSPISVGACQSKERYWKSEGDESVAFSVYASTMVNPEYVTDKGCFLLGETILHFAEHEVQQGIDLEAEMSFSGTEIEFICKNLSSGKISKLKLESVE